MKESKQKLYIMDSNGLPIGYVFMGGNGKVAFPDKTIIQLGPDKRGFTLGHPVKEFQEYKGLLIMGVGKEPKKDDK